MAAKRNFDHDPDYEDAVSQIQQKRQRLIENDGKQATVSKIKTIIQQQFSEEIEAKKSEVDDINKTLNHTRLLLDKLRACAVAKYYCKTSQVTSTQSKSSVQAPSIHPAVKQFLGKAPLSTSPDLPQHSEPVQKKVVIASEVEEVNLESNEVTVNRKDKDLTHLNVMAGNDGKRLSQFKIKKRIIVGNISRYIPFDKRDELDQATHKWMVYVRGSKQEPHIHQYVKKVFFFLHPSYRPNDLVEIRHAPFHLTRRGWGEFPIRIQLHFHDPRNKPVDIIHNLKFDRSYTGLQTLGAETVVDVELERSKETLKNLTKSDRRTEKKHSTEQPTAVNIAATSPSNNGSGHLKSPRKNQVKSALKSSPKKAAEQISSNKEKTSASPKVSNDVGPSIMKKTEVTKPQNSDALGVSKKSPTGSPPLALHGQTSPIGSRSPGLNTFYVRCVDNQGRVFLVPPHMLSRDPNNAGKLCLNSNTVKSPTKTVVKQESVSPKLLNLVTQTSKSKPVVIDQTGARKDVKYLSPSLGKMTAHILGLPASNTMHIKQERSTSTSPIKSSSVGLLMSKNLTGKTTALIGGNSFGALTNQSVASLQSHDAVQPTMQPPPKESQGKATIPDMILPTFKPLHGPQVSLLKSEPHSVNVTNTSSSGLAGIPCSVTSQTPGNSIAANPKGSTAANAIISAKVGQNSLLSIGNQTKQLKLLLNKSPNNQIVILQKPSKIQENSQSSTTNMKQVDLVGQSETENKTKSVFNKQNYSTSDITKMTDLIQQDYSLVTTHRATPTHCNWDDFDSIESLVKKIICQYPLVSELADHRIHPYCATSKEQFLSWNIGKQRAAQWQRCVWARCQLVNILKDCTRLEGESLWSTRQMVMWCRHNHYTPMPKGITCFQKHQNPRPLPRQQCSTFSDIEEVQHELRGLAACGKENIASGSDSEIDIINIDDQPPHVLRKTESPIKQEQKDVMFIPQSALGLWTGKKVKQIGVHFKPIEILPDTLAFVNEEMIAATLKELCDDILRQSISLFSEHMGKLPKELNEGDIYRALSYIKHCDFFTNTKTGVESSLHKKS